MNELKKAYLPPSMEQVKLDNEISLVLASGDIPWEDPIAALGQGEMYAPSFGLNQ